MASEAHRRIAELVELRGHAWIERKCGLGQGTVRQWLKHERIPHKSARARIAEALGIGEELWPTRAESPAPAAVQKPTEVQFRGGIVRAATHRTPPPGADDSPERAGGLTLVRAEVTDADDPKANAIATLRILRVALERAEAEEIPRLANAVTSSSRLLARLAGSLDVTEAQILRSAAWARLVKMIREVLAGYPLAAAELDKRMGDYEQGL